MRNERSSVAQRRLKSSAFLDANSSSVRMFFWRSSARRSIVLTMSSTTGCVAGGGAVAAARVSDRGACAGSGAEPDCAELRGRSPSGTTRTRSRDAHEAILAGERQRLIAALLLAESRDPVLAGVIDADLPSLLDRQLARAGKAGVPEIILSASGGGTAQFGGPPLAGRAGARHEQTEFAAATRRL